jgi:carbamoyltransferase
VRFVPVPHHLAHAASAYLASGFDRAAALTADAMGEFDSAGAWDCHGTSMEKRWEVLLPFSLGTFYTAVTEWLGFEPNDGEYKTMGMAAYGDPSRADLSPFCRIKDGVPWCDPRQIFPPKKFRSGGKYYGEAFDRILGPPGDGAKAEPYVHVAAAAQEIVEKTLLGWLEDPLRGLVEGAGGALCLAGGIALNVRANGRILELPFVKRLFVQPASSDAGGSLGAALWAAASLGDRIEPVKDAFLGPESGREAIRGLLEARRIPFREPAELASEVAALLAGGAVVARFDGRMEWGPRALGNRSILAHPGIAGMADRINAMIKFREPWRPFCPAVLESRAGELFGAREPSPAMTVNFRVDPGWRERISQVTHVDGTARIQTVDPVRAPGFHAILEAFEKKTGLPVLLNTSLNRRGEPIACTPEDALSVFFGSGLEHLVLGPFLLSKAELGSRRTPVTC